MMTAPFRSLGLATLCLIYLTSAGRANTLRDEGVFDFYIHGFRAGILVFAGVRQGNYYAVNGRFQSAGIVSIFRKLSYKASVTGQIVKGKPQPQTYTLTDAEGARSHTETLSWTGDTPQPLVRVPPHKLLGPHGAGQRTAGHGGYSDRDL